MAKTVWQSSDGAFGAASSWSNGVPNASNTPALYDGTSQHDVIPGTLDFDVNRGSDDFEVVVTPEYSGIIASASSPLTWGATTKRVTFRGSGQLFMSNAFADVFVDSDNRQDAVTIDAYAFLMAKHGGVRITSTAVLKKNWIIGDARMTVEPDTDVSASEWHIKGGIVICDREISSSGLIHIAGGRLRQSKVCAGPFDVLGGRLEYWPDPETVSTAAVTLLGGILDLSENSVDVLTGAQIIKGPEAIVIGKLGGGSGVSFVTYDLAEDYP